MAQYKCTWLNFLLTSRLNKTVPGLLLATIVLAYSPGSLASWILTVSESDGLPQVSIGGQVVLKSDYVFWDQDWGWAGLQTDFSIETPMKYSVSGVNRKSGIKLNSEIRKISNNKVKWTFDLDTSRTKHDAIRGGIRFRFNLRPAVQMLGEPELLSDDRGWIWGDTGESGIKIEFEPRLESVHFERGKKSEVRAFIYQEKTPAGQRSHAMTITLYGDFRIEPTLSERFEILHSKSWIKQSPDLQTVPVDLSFLNASEKPAGIHGFLRAVGEHLEFENGTKASFWGTNITARALFKTSKANITRQAKRLSAMGFNLARLHHHDSSWVRPNVFEQKSGLDTQSLSQSSLDKIDWWIKSLKDEGIYIWLDLHVGRQLTEHDNIYAFDEIGRKNGRGTLAADLRGYNYVNPSIKNAMKRFNRQYLTHVNPYTKLAYKDDPAIVAMLITNENDITNHFSNRLLPNKKVPRHNRLYMQEARNFALEHELSTDETWQSWNYGSSKLFLNDLEHRFNQEMIDDLWEIDVRVPVATTNTWGYNPLASLPSLTDGDIIDVHAYGTALELEKDPFLAPSITTWLAAGQAAGKPMSVSEWNISPFPAPDRHLTPLLISSKASHQGWDALMQYAYAKESLDNIGKPSNWVSRNDPAFLATMPAAALMFRRGHVREASTTYYLAPGRAMFYENISPATSPMIRSASEIGKLVIGVPETRSLPWLKPSSPPDGAVVVEDYSTSLLAPGVMSVTTDTGEITRDWKQGIYTIDTPQSQVAMGWLGGKTLELTDSRFEIGTPNAVVAVQSLDRESIRESNAILVSLSSISVPHEDINGNQMLPFLSQPLKGEIAIQSRNGLRLYRIDAGGNREKLDADYVNGEYRINLDRVSMAHWLILTSDKPEN